jgi:hypothetical protein
VLEGAGDNASVGLVLPRFKYPSHPERDALVIEEIMERMSGVLQVVLMMKTLKINMRNKRGG